MSIHKSQKTMDDLVRDLTDPLTVIYGYLDILSNRKDFSVDDRRIILTMLGMARSMEKILKKLL